LLNSLLNERRSIVTDISGTTRDTIEEALRLSGFVVRVVDTAGLHETSDPVELEGIKRTEAEIDDADVVAYVVDASQANLSSDIVRLARIVSEKGGPQRVMLVVNKIDLAFGWTPPPSLPAGIAVYKVSAKTGSGLDGLKRSISERCFSGSVEPSEKSVVITNARHQASLMQAREALQRSLESIRAGQSNEFIAVDMHASLRHLGEITGATTTEDVLNNIFASFCIGK
jgi:tRNA modification GTPase